MRSIFEYDGNGMKKQKKRKIEEAYISSAGCLVVFEVFWYKLRQNLFIDRS